MNCEIWEIMDKNEKYVRGWIRLYETASNTAECAQMAEYAINLMQLKNMHEEHCDTCRK